MYNEMKSGAETGWDYSSRWMITDDDTEKPELHHTKPTHIIPVDLNSFMEKNARILAAFARDILMDEAAAEKYTAVANNLRDAINAVLWSDADGSWFDYDMVNKSLRKQFFPSNYVPLWTGSGLPEENKMARKQTEAAVESLRAMDMYPGGVPTSKVQTGEQWDFPNCWPPLEHMLVVGLERTGLEEAKELAFKIAEGRVRGAYVNHLTKGHMFEKVILKYFICLKNYLLILCSF
jgi:alpha,alpha-trehalase